MKEVMLTQGQVAVVDDEDFDRVSAHNWSAKWNKKMLKFYARTNIGHGAGNQKTVELQRFIMGEPVGVLVDHRDGNTLDCRRENLRCATWIESARNRGKQSNGRSRFKGVCIREQSTKAGVQIRYYAHIEANGKQRGIGHFVIETDAALAYDSAARELFGVFARLNFPQPGEVSAL